MAEMIFACPHCSESIQCDSEFAGQTVACPLCEGGIIVPAAPLAPVEEPENQELEPQPVPETEVEPEPEIAVEPEPVEEPQPEPTPEPEEEAEQQAQPESPEGPAPIPAPAEETEPEAQPEPVEEVEPELEPEPEEEPAPAPKTGGKKIITKRRIITKKKISAPRPQTAAGGNEQVPEETAEQAPSESQAAIPELAPGQVPPKASGWSWAAFFWGPIWAIGNKVWSGLLTLLPGIGFIFLIILACTGKKKAWEKGNWRDIDHFVKVQRRWVKIALVIMVINIALITTAALMGGLAAFKFGGALGDAAKCNANLVALEVAKQSVVLETNAQKGDSLSVAKVAEYLPGGSVTCPKAGVYSINPAGTAPTCSIGGMHTLAVDMTTDVSFEDMDDSSAADIDTD